MIGPSFAAGFLDLAMLRGLVDEVPTPLRAALPPGGEQLDDLTAHEIAYFEQTLLQMQTVIFYDQGLQHQACVDGELAAIEGIAAAGVLRPKSLAAWRDIATGEAARVTLGNRLHLEREQQQLIKDSSDDMRNRFPTGPAITWAMTFIGSPSTPGARSYPDVFPAVIEQDTLPAFQDLLERDPAQAQTLLEQPVGERIEDYRLATRWPDLVAQLADWDVEVRQ